jgi:tetratricopeptide (TPR) repeat protein
VSRERVRLVGAAESLSAAYCRKVSALRPADREALQGRNVMFAEMGHTTTTVIIVRVLASSGKGDEGVHALAAETCGSLGALSFDLCLFRHFAAIVEQKSGGEKVVPGTKRGFRLMSGCERVRKLLSQLTEAQVTVENLTDAGDVSFSLRREELAAICAEPLLELQNLVRAALAAAASPEGGAPEGVEGSNAGPVSIAAAEILGGGMRMQVAQAALLEALGEGVSIGAKFDDGSAALGGCILVNRAAAAATAAAEEAVKQQTAVPVASGEEKKEGEVSEGDEQPSAPAPVSVPVSVPVPVVASSLYKVYSTDAPGSAAQAGGAAAARARELGMQAQDEQVRQLLAGRNSLEAFMYETKSCAAGKHGQLIDAAQLAERMDAYDNWLWDNPPESTSLEQLQTQFALVQREMGALTAAYSETVRAEKAEFEKQLEEESQRAAAERAAEGEDEDHDNRKLKKPDRMRMVVKNKEEATELFKGKNYRPAAARYHKSLTHASKFFDLSPDDEVEVNALKLSLYLNLSQCYIKLENWDNVLRNVEDALKIDPSNPKALFRRSVAYEAKKDYEKALADLKRAQELNPEDVIIQKAHERVMKLIAKEVAKEKKMWGRAFGGGSKAPADGAATAVSPPTAPEIADPN